MISTVQRFFLVSEHWERRANRSGPCSVTCYNRWEDVDKRSFRKVMNLPCWLLNTQSLPPCECPTSPSPLQPRQQKPKAALWVVAPPLLHQPPTSHQRRLQFSQVARLPNRILADVSCFLLARGSPCLQGTSHFKPRVLMSWFTDVSPAEVQCVVPSGLQQHHRWVTATTRPLCCALSQRLSAPVLQWCRSRADQGEAATPQVSDSASELRGSGSSTRLWK